MGHIAFHRDVRPYVRTCVGHIRNPSLTNVTFYIQVYMQVYLHIYIHIYVQVARNFDTFYATKLKFGMIFTQTKTLDFMVELPLRLAPGRGQGSECITGHIEHMQNGNRIIRLVPLLALES